MRKERIIKCIDCGNSRLYRSKKPPKRCSSCYLKYQGRNKLENRRLAAQRATKKRHDLKKLFVELKGGICNRCGNVFQACCFDFHHIDPRKKDFIISESYVRQGKVNVFAELDKCILLCKNCHYLLHYGQE